MANDGTDEDDARLGTLKIAEPTTLPEVLDVFVAGGGPAGTAAARARQGARPRLSGRRLRRPDEAHPGLPEGEADQAELRRRRQAAVPGRRPDARRARTSTTSTRTRWSCSGRPSTRSTASRRAIGSEFTGLARGADGIWDVKTWSHRAGEEMRYRARNVLLAIGAGVPRRFDIPGNTEGLAFRLDDAKDYVGEPALVIGGGTSAAEAVIAISDAKIAAEDETAVYWSYRGDKHAEGLEGAQRGVLRRLRRQRQHPLPRVLRAGRGRHRPRQARLLVGPHRPQASPRGGRPRPCTSSSRSTRSWRASARTCR